MPSISATPTTGVRLAHPRIPLYTGMTPQPARLISGLVRGVSARCSGSPTDPPHAPCANQVRQLKLLILWPPRCRRRSPTDGMTWPRPRRSVKSLWSTPTWTLSHRPRQRHSRGLPTRHTPRHPSGSCRGLSPPCHRLKGPPTHLLPCGRDVAGTWLHSPILPTCISSTFAQRRGTSPYVKVLATTA